MAVLPHEGQFNILYRSYAVPVGSAFQPGYLARPDQIGEYPGVLILPDIYGLTSLEKTMCRRLARHGMVAIAIDLYREKRPGPVGDLERAVAAYAQLDDRRALTDIDDAYEFMMSDDVGWIVDGPIGIVGLDTGGRFGLLYASDRPHVGAVVAVQAPLAGDEERGMQVASVLERLTMPVLGLYGRDDELVPSQGVDVAAGLNGTGTWILYEDTGHDFLNDGTDGYHAGAADDAMVRIERFLAANLPSAVIPAY